MKRPALLLALVLLTGCSIWPVEKRLLSKNDYIRTVTLKQAKTWDDATRSRVIAAMLAALSHADDRQTHRATEALIAIGSPAVDPTVTVLTSEDPFVRTLAVSVLGEIGDPAPTVEKALISTLKDPHPLVREEAAHGLGRLNGASPDALPALTATLQDPDPAVRAAAQESLKRLETKTLKTS